MRYIYVKRRYRILFSLMDAIGAIVFFPLKLFRSKLPRHPPKILLIRTDHIGDVLSATAVFEPLRNKFPDASIEVMVASWAADLLEHHPHINAQIRFDAPWFDRRNSRFFYSITQFFKMIGLIKNGRYDVAIDLRGDVRHISALFLARVAHRISYGIFGGGFLLTCKVPYEGILHETKRNMALLVPLGIDEPPADIKIYFSEKDAQNVSILRKKENIDGAFAVLHTVPGNPLRTWVSEKFAALAKYIHDTYELMPIVIGSAADRDKISPIISAADVEIRDVTGKLSLLELAGLLKQASLFVGVDSGPAHIAGAVGIPSVIIFSGINDPRQWTPKGDHIRVVHPAPDQPISSIRMEDVSRAIEEILKGYSSFAPPFRC